MGRGDNDDGSCRHRDHELLTRGDAGQMSPMRPIDQTRSESLLLVLYRRRLGKRTLREPSLSVPSPWERGYEFDLDRSPAIHRARRFADKKTTDWGEGKGDERRGMGDARVSLLLPSASAPPPFRDSNARGCVGGYLGPTIDCGATVRAAGISYDGRRVLNEPAWLGFRRRPSRAADGARTVSVERARGRTQSVAAGRRGDCSRVPPPRENGPARVIAPRVRKHRPASLPVDR
uniref:Uncharacterized protein n=1 Tax=Plectus sambesii TaxID=2011161 RepID=A0A914WRR7_9BILA